MLHRVTVLPGDQVAVPLMVEIANNELYSADLAVTCDPAVATAVEVTRGPLTTPGVGTHCAGWRAIGDRLFLSSESGPGGHAIQ